MALVTGASDGIGRALCEGLAAAGVRLVLVARTGPDLDDLAPKLEALGSPSVLPVAGDVADPATAHRAVEKAVEAFGRLDLLVNNAGIGLRSAVERVEPDQMRRLLEVNLLGPMHFIRAAVPLMRDGEHGREGMIVNISSMAGLVPVPFLGAYGASKAALIALTGALRLELSGTGIGVLSVIPGTVATRFKTRALGEPYPERRRARRTTPEQAAAKIIRAIESGRRELFILSRNERLGLIAGKVLPGYMERKILRMYG